MNNKPTNPFALINTTAAEIRADRLKPRISEVRTAGLNEVIQEECARGDGEGTRWVGHTSNEPTKSRIR